MCIRDSYTADGSKLLYLPTGNQAIGKEGKLTLSDGVKEITRLALAYNPKLKELTLPASLERIDAMALTYNGAMTVSYTHLPLASVRDQLYYLMWQHYGIQSDLGYGDYHDSCLFAVAAAATLLAVTPQLASPGSQTIAIYNEWITGMGLLYHRLQQPNLRSLFITHATTVGRSICSLSLIHILGTHEKNLLSPVAKHHFARS